VFLVGLEMLNGADNQTDNGFYWSGSASSFYGTFQVPRPNAGHALSCPTLQPHSYTTRRVSGVIYRSARGASVKCLASSRYAGGENAVLLRRPGHWAIGRAVRRSMHKLIAASVEMTGHGAFGGFPLVFFIEKCNQFTDVSAGMASENRRHHIDAGETVLARSASVGCCLRPTAAGSRATELFGCGGRLKPCCRLLLSCGRRGWHLSSDSTSINCASLQQLDDRSLFRL
jgi:hypothetical protein